MAKKIRVLVVENDPDFIYLLEKAIRDQADMELAACCSDKEQAVYTAQRLKPDVVLMDLSLSDCSMDGIEAAKEIRVTTAAKIIILTAFENPQIVIDASKKAFASGYVFKSQFEMLLETIRKTAHGHTPQEQMISSMILSDLTVAERAVLKSLAGQKNSLQSSQKTIANQKTTILHKLELKTQKQLEQLCANRQDYFNF